MTRAQKFLNQLYDEGHFSDVSFFAIVDNINWDPTNKSEDWFTPKAKTFGKSRIQQFEDALKVVEFMMQDGVFEAHFYGDIFSVESRLNGENAKAPTFMDMLKQRFHSWKRAIKKANHPGWPTKEVKAFAEFGTLVRSLFADDPKIFIGGLEDIRRRRFDIMLGQIKKGADAPTAPLEIEKIFSPLEGYVREYFIDCYDVKCEEDFWEAYLVEVNPEGAQNFGRNLDAFWDAVSAGGPGWPGECTLRFINTDALAAWRQGEFVSRLREIAAESTSVVIRLE